MSANSLIESNEPKTVVPSVALTKNGISFALKQNSIISFSLSDFIFPLLFMIKKKERPKIFDMFFNYLESTGTYLTWSRPKPKINADFPIE